MPPSTDASEIDGGLYVSPRFAELAKKPGFLRCFSGGQEMRMLYREPWDGFDVTRLPTLAALCVVGAFDELKEIVEYPNGPSINFAETFTPFKLSYATLIIYGAQRVTNPQRQKHHEMLKYLISRHSLPVDIPDIVGMTTLHHCFSTESRINVIPLARTVLEAGANVDYQNRYGEVVLFITMAKGNVEGTELLMEFGAKEDVKEADGLSPISIYTKFGPEIVAVMDKWMRRRRGEEEAPRTGKKCDWPGCETKMAAEGGEVKLKNCAKCMIARYCGAECQKKHWRTHKKTCKALSEASVLTFVPRYDEANIIPNEVSRVAMGARHDLPPNSHFRPPHFTSPDSLIIKIQVPSIDNGMNAHMLVYDKKRSFVCSLWKQDNLESYQVLDRLIREKGPQGSKGYFLAEVVDKYKLVVRIDEMLASQPF